MTWVAALPYVFQVLAFILQRIGASNDVIAAFKNLIEKSKDDGLISQHASDKFKTLHQQVMDQFKGDPNAPSTPGPQDPPRT